MGNPEANAEESPPPAPEASAGTETLPPLRPMFSDTDEASRIYLLPNLMTAGNLFCGFVAIIRCIQAKFASTAEGLGVEYMETVARTPAQLYEQAVWFILAAVIFDVFDGLMARLTRKESLFGKEFDSLADVVSFGMAPALLVFFLLLSPTAEFPLVRTIGGIVGFFYLLCAAIRLARYNVLTSPLLPHSKRFPEGVFIGLPVPAAAGTVSGFVLIIQRFEIPALAFLLPVLLVIIALLMISNVHFLSTKQIGWHTQLGLLGFIGLLVLLVALFIFHYLAVLIFLAYIAYGLIRHFRRGGTARNSRKAQKNH